MNVRAICEVKYWMREHSKGKCVNKTEFHKNLRSMRDSVNAKGKLMKARALCINARSKLQRVRAFTVDLR